MILCCSPQKPLWPTTAMQINQPIIIEIMAESNALLIFRGALERPDHLNAEGDLTLITFNITIAECFGGNLMREYRRQLVEAGQASPLPLSQPVIHLIKERFLAGVSILDVGCGLGHQMSNIISNLPNYFSHVEGIDWCPPTVEYHKGRPSKPYNRIILGSSDTLPYKDFEFDICLSMENLEHLYGDKSIHALREMMRVSKNLIITTPTPADVVNFDWLHREIKEAADDDLPLPHREYICLESAVHKSILMPDSMIEAGFRRFGNHSHSFFWAESGKINLDHVRCIGIREREEGDGVLKNSQEFDYGERYIKLLIDSIALDAQIPSKSLDAQTPSIALDAQMPSFKKRGASFYFQRFISHSKSYLLRKSPPFASFLKKVLRRR